jgi:hypothetical protein
MPKKTRTKKHVQKLRKQILLQILFGVFFMVALAIVGFVFLRPDFERSGPIVPLSRKVLELAEVEVRRSKPAPTDAARQYAYVASAYQDALMAGSQADALAVAEEILTMLYPEQASNIHIQVQQLAAEHGFAMASSDVSRSVIDRYQQRHRADGHDLTWDGVIPAGPGKWIKTKPGSPFTPRAGDWQRWVVGDPITVAAPPMYGTAEDTKQLGIVQQAVAMRTGDDVNKINFWGGTPGTDSPAGIWQNQLYKTIQNDLSKDRLKADHLYSQIQATLAQATSDAFMECWKLKYTYWTARPSMRIAGLQTAMENPNFPSYISGHSTISKRRLMSSALWYHVIRHAGRQWRLKPAIQDYVLVYTLRLIIPLVLR